MIYHALTSSVCGVMKSSQTLYGYSSCIISVYGIWGIWSFCMTALANTSLYGSCCVAPLPPFMRHRFPSIIVHFFFSQPSEVLSGDIKLICQLDEPFPNKTFPTSSEKEFSKKFTSVHVMLVFTGQIQYWSDKLNPIHLSTRFCVVLRFSSFRACLIPCRLAGIALPCHHSFKDALSISFFFTAMPIGTWATL